MVFPLAVGGGRAWAGSRCAGPFAARRPAQPQPLSQRGRPGRRGSGPTGLENDRFTSNQILNTLS